jgi:hypothetical protein
MLALVSPSALDGQDNPRGAANSLLEQPARLTITNTTLERAIEQLRQSSGVPIAFSLDLLPSQLRVSCACEAVTVAAALDTLLQGTDLGYRVLGAQVLIAPTHQATATGDPDDVIAQLCADGTVQVDQGVMVGFVRDAATHNPVVDARVIGTWPTVSDVLAELVTDGNPARSRGEVVTDGAGVYAACGIPARTPVVFHATFGDLASDFIEVRFDSGGVFVGGTFHQTEAPTLRQDLSLAPPSQRTAAVTGLVLEEQMLPLVGATVEILDTGLQTTTGVDGSFTLTNLPAGPVQLAVRHPGFRPQTRDIELQHGETVTFPPGGLRLEPLPPELAPVVVEAEEARTRRPLREFWERREHSSGHFITREEFEKQGNPQRVTDVLRRMGGIRVVGNATGGNVVLMNRTLGPRSFELQRGPCYPLYFLDGRYIGKTNEFDVDNLLPLTDVEAVEAYSSLAMPREFARKGFECGVIVFWTR